MALHLPAVAATRIHGWLTTMGLTRVLAQRWPDLTLCFDETFGSPIFNNGPRSIAEAAAAIIAATIDPIPDGGALPDVPPDYPPPGKDWWRRHTDPPRTTDRWPGAAGLWQAALTTPSGLLHPLISPHAAQTVRGMVEKPGALLREDPTLLTRALHELGLDDRYPGGLWLLRHAVNAADSGDGKPRSAASPGRDWLTLMGLPWMAAADDYVHRSDPNYRRCAPGWRWRYNAAGTAELVYSWHLWADPLPAGAVPFILGQPPDYLPKVFLHCGAHRPRRGPHDPPMMAEFTRGQIGAGRLDDAQVLGYPDVAQRAGISVQTLRTYISRGQCPRPDAYLPGGKNKAWHESTIRPWLDRDKRPGARTDRRAAQ